MSEISPKSVLAKSTIQAGTDMAKIQLKSDNINPFGGLFSILNIFNRGGLRSVIDQPLGRRGGNDRGGDRDRRGGDDRRGFDRRGGDDRRGGFDRRGGDDRRGGFDRRNGDDRRNGGHRNFGPKNDFNANTEDHSDNLDKNTEEFF